MINAMPLEFTKKEVVSSTTFIHQVENGTIFFRDGTTVWVQQNDKKVKVELDGGFDYSIVAAQSDSLYYGSNWKRKIYKAELKPSGTIEMEFVREMVEGESIHPGGIMSFVENAEVYVYRMCDDPIQDRIQLEDLKKILSLCDLAGIHENFVVLKYLSINPGEPILTAVASNCTMLRCYRGLGRRFMEFNNEVQTHTEYNSPWGSPTIVKREYIYLTNGKSLFVINPADHTLKQPLYFVDVSSFYIAGVHEGILTGRGKCEKTGKFYHMTAQLPSDFVTNPQIHLTICDGFVRVDNPVVARLREQQTITTQSQNTSATTQEPTYSSRFLNDYEFDRVLGKGGFGCVFKVTSKIDKAEYAIKRITKIARHVTFLLNLNRKVEALREAEKMVRLEHPGIVRYFTAWVEEPPEGWQDRVDYEMLGGDEWRDEFSSFKHNDVFIYIPMKLCKCSLEDWLKGNQEASSRNRTVIKSWFREIVSAVQYLHAEGLIHSDLKPGNILFDENDRIKLCDFGIATERVFDDNTEVTATRDSAASPIYASPEQLSGFFTRYKSSTDIFPLGLIFAELCIIFNSYRLGSPRNAILEDVETANFVALLANKKPECRPTCMEILEHPFLAN